MPKKGDEQNLNSALNLWQEAVEKASVDLDKIVNNSIKQLAEFSKDLEESLDNEIRKAAGQTETNIVANVDDLSAKKDDLSEELTEHERQVIERIITLAQETRSRVDRLVSTTRKQILSNFQEDLKELSTLLDNPKQHFEDFSSLKQDSIDSVVSSAREKTVTKEDASKSILSKTSDELHVEVSTVVGDSKERINNKLESYSKGFDEKISQVLSQLDSVLEETEGSAGSTAAEGLQRIQNSREKNEKFLDEHIEGWKQSVDTLKTSFEKDIEEATADHLQNHTRRLEYQVSEAKASITHATQDANARVAAIHKSFYASLKRMERMYLERIETQVSDLQSLMDDEKALPSSIQQLSGRKEELKKKVHSELEMRGNELTKSIRKQVEQMEADYRRASSSSHERIDSIKLQTIESLEKQVRIIRSELDRVNNSFKAELSQLTTELPEIEERGRVAAMSVSAYLASMLTLETD